jgi:hypothetical protein
MDLRMSGGKNHMVIQLLYDSSECVSEGDEINDIAILIQRTFHLGADPVVVAVQALADITCEGDEVSGAKDQLFFLKLDAIGAVHPCIPVI